MIIIKCDRCLRQIDDAGLLKVTTAIRQTRINDPSEESLHFHKECWKQIRAYIATGV